MVLFVSPSAASSSRLHAGATMPFVAASLILVLGAGRRVDFWLSARCSGTKANGRARLLRDNLPLSIPGSGDSAGSPAPPHSLGEFNRIENGARTLPVDVFDAAVLGVEGVLPQGGRPVDEHLGLYAFALRDAYPDVLQRVGDLPEQRVNSLEALGQELMNAVFDGPSVSQVRDPHLAVPLADPLDASLALFEARRIPGQVDVDECAQSL